MAIRTTTGIAAFQEVASKVNPGVTAHPVTTIQGAEFFYKLF